MLIPLVKEKFWVQWSVKKFMLTAFWDMKGPIDIDFLEKRATVNGAPNHQLLKQNLSHFLHDHYIYIYIYLHVYTNMRYVKYIHNTYVNIHEY